MEHASAPIQRHPGAPLVGLWQRSSVDLTLKAFQEFGVSLVAEMDPNASGDMGHIERDAPSIQVIDSPEIKHTDADIAERVPDAGLAAVARAYAKIIDEVNKVDRKDLLPTSMAATK